VSSYAHIAALGLVKSRNPLFNLPARTDTRDLQGRCLI
jgi:hypothetical protein